MVMMVVTFSPNSSMFVDLLRLLIMTPRRRSHIQRVAGTYRDGGDGDR